MKSKSKSKFLSPENSEEIDQRLLRTSGWSVKIESYVLCVSYSARRKNTRSGVPESDWRDG